MKDYTKFMNLRISKKKGFSGVRLPGLLLPHKRTENT